MDRYLVEVHVPEGLDSADARSQALTRLQEHSDVLPDPEPKLPAPDADRHTVAQFTIEADSPAAADAKGREIAGLLAQEFSDDDSPLEISLASARRLDGR